MREQRQRSRADSPLPPFAPVPGGNWRCYTEPMVRRRCDLRYLDAHDRAVELTRPVPLLRPPFSGRQPNLFDMLHVGGIVAGIWIGITTGNRTGGVIGAMIGGILGSVVGHFAGIAPWHAFWAIGRLNTKLTSTERLRKKLQTDQFQAAWLIAEMIRRGEPVESFWPWILSLLESDSFYERAHGWDNLNIWFPRIAKQIDGLYSPQTPTARCKKYVTRIRNAEPCAAPLPSDSEGADWR
jgi:hypothetical protein